MEANQKFIYYVSVNIFLHAMGVCGVCFSHQPWYLYCRLSRRITSWNGNINQKENGADRIHMWLEHGKNYTIACNERFISEFK